MSTTWQPNPEGLNQILTVLRNVTNAQYINQVEAVCTHTRAPPNTNNPFFFFTHTWGDKQAVREYQTKLADWPLYLCHVLTSCPGETAATRSFAAVLLKQYMEANPALAAAQPAVVATVKSSLVRLLADADADVRHRVASVVTRVLSEVELRGWPELLPSLCGVLAAPDSAPALLDGALYTLKLVVEDQRRELCDEANGAPINALAPLLLRHLASADAAVRENALCCIGEYVLDMPPVYLRMGDALLKALFALTGDAVPAVRKLACRAIVSLAQLQTDVVAAYIAPIVKYLVAATQDSAPDVAAEALAFWEEVDKDDDTHDAVRPHLAELVPLLIARTQYTPDEAEHVLDDERKYLSGAAKGLCPHHTYESGCEADVGVGDGNDGDENDSDEDEDDDDDDDVLAGEEEFPMRVSASHGLDSLAQTFGAEILPYAVPQIDARMRADPAAQWPVVESAIFALGAIADGCGAALGPHLPGLLSFLVAHLEHPRSCVRATACWTLGRFAPLIAADANTAQTPAEAEAKPYRAIMFALLARMRDAHPAVRQAACTTFATITEAAGAAVHPYLETFLGALVDVFRHTREGEYAAVYDAINTVVEAAGARLNSERCLGVLVPPLVERWNALADSDDDLGYLLECWTAIAAALGAGFAPYCRPVYDRCVQMLTTAVAERRRRAQAQTQTPSHVLQDGDDDECTISADLVQCALELVSTMTECFDARDLDALFGATPIAALACECCTLASPDVLQSAFCLVGDLASCALERLRPCLAGVVPLLVDHLVPTFPRVYINASWALGTIAMACPDAVAPHVQAATAKLALVLDRVGRVASLKNLLANTTICCGRMVLIAPDYVAPRIAGAPKLFHTWCDLLAVLPNDEERIDAVRGLCTVCARCPEQLAPRLDDVVGVFACLHYAPHGDTADIYQTIVSVLLAFRPLYGANWQAQVARWNAAFKCDLAQMYPAIL